MQSDGDGALPFTAPGALASRFNPRFDGEGSHTVILGHGLGTDQQAWQQQAQVLSAAGYRVLRFDFAGATPDSARYFSPRHHRTLYGYAEDLLVLMHGLGVEHASYVGHSIGGSIGLLACLAEPERFRSLIVLGSSARYLDDPTDGYVGGFSRHAVDTLLQAAVDDYARWANGFAPGMVGAANPHLTAAEFSRHLLSLRPDIVHAVLQAALLSDYRAEVQQLVTPLYVLQAQVDVAVSPFAARWLAANGRARDLIELPTEGHLPHITAPELVNRALLSCLARSGND